jgi:hypothetical protein
MCGAVSEARSLRGAGHDQPDRLIRQPFTSYAPAGMVDATEQGSIGDVLSPGFQGRHRAQGGVVGGGDFDRPSRQHHAKGAGRGQGDVVEIEANEIGPPKRPGEREE